MNTTLYDQLTDLNTTTDPEIVICDRNYLHAIIEGHSSLFYAQEDKEKLIQEFVDHTFLYLTPKARKEINRFKLWMVVEFCFFLQRMELAISKVKAEFLFDRKENEL